MTTTLPTPWALYRDTTLTETDRRVFITLLEEDLADLVDMRELKLAVLAGRISRAGGGRAISRSWACRSLERLVRAGYLEVEAGTHAHAPKRYRIRLSAFRKSR